MRLTQEQIDHLRSLENRDGTIEAARVVEDAKLPSSPLHAVFDFDVERCIRRDLLHQAREIIASVTVQVIRQEMTIKASCYVHLPGTSSYQRVDAARKDDARARESLVYTLEVAAGHIRRAYDLAGPLGLGGEVDLLLSKIAGVQRLAGEKAA